MDEFKQYRDFLKDSLRKTIDFSRPWVGSTNQRFHFLTDRYLKLAAMLETMPNKIEVRLKPDGRILINPEFP